MHPYEIDTEELAVVKNLYGDIPLKWRLSQFIGRGSVEPKLHKLMNDYSFTSFEREYYSEDKAPVLHGIEGGKEEHKIVSKAANTSETESIIATFV